MTVSSASYTTGSVKITVSGEFSSNALITAVNTALTSAALGSWTLYDSIVPQAVGNNSQANSFSPIWTNVYRVLNYDATTYKYWILRYDTIKCCIYTSAAESWNNSTHVSTNETWTGAGVFPQHYDVRDSFVLLSASARHCVLWPFIKNEPGMWSGIFEFERIAAEDTTAANVPCYAWTNSLMLGTPWGRPTSATKSNVMFAFPRTADGSTGALAAQVYAPVTNRGMYPPNYPSGSGSITDNNMIHLGSYFNMSYGWDATKTVASPVAADSITKSQPVGRMFNVGITKSVGNFLDTTYLNLDATGGWPDSAGSNTEVLLLPLNGGFEGNTTAGAQLTFTYGLGNSVPIAKAIPVGSTVFAAANDGVRVWSSDSGSNTPTTALPGTGTIITDIIFDGQDSVFAAGPTAVYRIQASNTANISSTTLADATSNGAAYLALDNAYLYITGRSANVQPKAYTISRLSAGGANALSAVATTYSNVGSVSTVAVNFGTPTPDYAGLCYVATQPSLSATTQVLKLASFAGNTGTQSANAANPIRSSAAVANGNYSTFHIDPTSGRIFLIASEFTTAVGSIYEMNTALANVSVNATALATNTTATINYQSSLVYTATGDGRADLNVVPIRGMFHVQPKRSGMLASGPTWLNRVHLISPQAYSPATPNTAFERGYANQSSYLTTDYAGAAAGIIYHNGPRTYAGDANSATNNNILVVKNYYSLNNINGTATGRVTVKG
jgi:hypothetical protein